MTKEIVPYAVEKGFYFSPYPTPENMFNELFN